MSDAVIAGKAPISVEVTAGKEYWWCSCGKSKTQPFCDGSHSGSTFAPAPYTASESKTVYFCACKQTSNQPLCDGSHAKI